MKKVILSFLILLLLMAGVGVGVYLIRQQTAFREKAAPSSTLTLVPSTTTPSIDDTFTVSSNIQTGTNEVIAVEMHLTFDSSSLEAVGASVGSFFTNAKNIGPSIDNNNGTLSYTVYIDPGGQAVKGSGTVAVFTFKAKRSGSSTIAFTNDTVVGANNSTGDLGQNVLTGSTNATIQVQSAATQVTPTPTIAPNQTATPTVRTTATNTPIPTATSQSTGGIADTNTPTMTPTRAVVPTTISELPDTGISLPTTLGIVVGIFVVIGSVLVAL